MNPPIEIRVRDVRLYRRFASYRFPFHVAGVSITGGEEVFVRVRVEDRKGRSAWGAAAESPAPTWFDKTRAADVVRTDIVRALRAAALLYTAMSADTPAGFWMNADPVLRLRFAAMPASIVSLATALIDRAVIDACCRIEGLSVFAAVRADRMGLALAAPADLAGFDLAGWLGSRPASPAAGVFARHTIGGTDALSPAEVVDPLNDGLPESLDQVVDAYGCRYFKIKIGTDTEATIERLSRIAAVLDERAPDWAATLDGNEQWRDPGPVLEMLRRLQQARPDIAARLMYLEQPLMRGIDVPLGELGKAIPCVLDEGDGTPDAFVRAHRLGWRGVSAKTCKGVYRALLNAARCAAWADGSFMSGEDLNHLPGLSMQQDLAMASILGLVHTERNGHHYAAGFDHAPHGEAQAFLEAHPDLYTDDGRRVRLRIEGGRVATGSFDGAGFASGATPDWDTLEPL